MISCANNHSLQFRFLFIGRYIKFVASRRIWHWFTFYLSVRLPVRTLAMYSFVHLAGRIFGVTCFRPSMNAIENGLDHYPLIKIKLCWETCNKPHFCVIAFWIDGEPLDRMKQFFEPFTIGTKFLHGKKPYFTWLVDENPFILTIWPKNKKRVLMDNKTLHAKKYNFWWKLILSKLIKKSSCLLFAPRHIYGLSRE